MAALLIANLMLIFIELVTNLALLVDHSDAEVAHLMVVVHHTSCHIVLNSADGEVIIHEFGILLFRGPFDHLFFSHPFQ